MKNKTSNTIPGSPTSIQLIQKAIRPPGEELIGDVVNVTESLLLCDFGKAYVLSAGHDSYSVQLPRAGMGEQGRLVVIRNPTSTKATLTINSGPDDLIDGNAQKVIALGAYSSITAWVDQINSWAIGVSAAVDTSIGSGAITSASSFAQQIFGAFSSTSAAAGSTVEVDCEGFSALQVMVTGTWTGAAIAFEGTVDGTNWFVVTANKYGAPSLLAGTSVAGFFRSTVASLKKWRARAVTGASGFTNVTVTWRLSSSDAQVVATDVLPVAGPSQDAGVLSNPVMVGGKTSASKPQTYASSADGQIPTISIIEAVQTGTVSGLATRINGQVSTALAAEAALRAGVWTELTGQAQRSLVSTSAVDSNGLGTGARKIRVTYYTLSAGVLSGPFVEDFLTNGVGAVNSTTVGGLGPIAKLEVIEGVANVGAISIMSGAGGAGTVVMQILAGERVSRYGLHYVPTGSVCMIKSWGRHTTDTGAADWSIRWKDLSLSAALQVERFAFVPRVDGNSVQYMREDLLETDHITGPAFIQAYVTPSTGAACSHRVSYLVVNS